MKIIQASVECAPFIKAGGLGDVVYGLSKALSIDHDVEILLPFYPFLFPAFSSKVLNEQFFSYNFLGRQNATATSYEYEGMTLTVITLDSQSELFSTSTIYTEDDTLRFSAFSAAAAAYIQKLDKVDVVHMHDWHVGLLAGLLKEPNLPSYPKRIFTIHNFSYRGYCSTQLLGASAISDFGLSNYQLFRDPNTSVLLKGALYCSDYITTVSPSYAQDILNDYSDYEIHDAIMSRRHVFCGILNGIDENIWNPETDPALAEHYGKNLLESPDVLFTKKEENKISLYEKLGLSLEYSPLMCVISRIVEQKGPEFMKAAILHAMENSYALVIAGTCYDQEIQRQFTNLQESLTASPNIRIILDYNDSLVRLIYGAADMICIPSHFEPCGLTQLIGMRYGTVPLVRSTGGLADTVTMGVNGFTFSHTDNFNDFFHMLSQAVSTYRHEPDVWFQLVEEGMLRPSGLTTMATHYLEVYNSLF
ncbi:glycogen synthase GlgA [Chlamydia psittaci]|uniref:glycogen synthase GlgA n=1 Tax=Chlamydia psittaci TaxID=83554 RepID=UPI00027E1BC4|nr:glycogen synthase GlgA [Chlamydia psittaci]EPJ25635.1 glycogen/starch synthase, ADP-glucose type family protein [Chlamydia psittaci 09DC77]EPJ30881.1 glycogen/starch synthase, ADP-glucose type family protein [Chlamydia psittaci 09DC78]EPL00844.1 glycogen/starch synthase, ADP-glucose type family protein [Chlamydia psittaci 09DC79]AFS21917.1 glycogen/starch synthase [Chlamydia psittaci MN]EPJ27098.1 glycogen/starch synthase, ADP-glucose type family protein [Chlamydia psittaci 09DC80]